MNSVELKGNEAAIKTAEEYIENLKQDRRRIIDDLNTMRSISKDAFLKEDAEEADVNYILGHSQGYVDGLNAAIAMVIENLSSEYRDIPMTSDEMYMLVDLGDARRTASLKNEKSKSVAEKSGWKMDWNGNVVSWRKETTKETSSCPF